MDSTYQAEWDKAWRAFEIVRAEDATYDRVIWRPAHEAAHAGGPPIPAHVSAEMQRRIDALCAAEDAIIKVPAPNLAAAIWKLDFGRERWADCEDLPEDWWKAIMSDLRRLEATVPDAHATWRASLTAWQQARQAHHEWQGPDDMPEDLCARENAAWRKMLDTPSPDLPALRMKLEQLLKIERCVNATNAWDAAEVRQTLADIANLLPAPT